LPLGCSVVALAFFAWATAQRLPYPHELEWMEGALADHAWRVAHGLPLYCAPSPEHVPFLYAPLPFWIGAFGIALGFDGITALRLMSLACTVATAMLVGHWTRVASGRFLPGFVATGLWFAGYGWLAWWYDLARNDTLFVFLCAITAYTLRYGGRRAWLWAALLATLAVLAKQSALMWLPAVGVGALCLDWRLGLRFGFACVGLMGAALGALHIGSDGWSTFWMFEMPRLHGWVGDRKLGYWTEDALPMLPLVLLALAGFAARWRDGGMARREALYVAAFGCGGLLCSWLSRLHVGGFDNVLMYGFAAACVLGPLGAAALPRRWQWAGVALLLAQFGWLGERALHRDPYRTLLPSAAHQQAHEELRAFVGAQPGPVWIPCHGHISTRAGKGTGAHGQAIFDLLQMLPKLPDGMFDLQALVDRSRLAGLPERHRLALGAFLDGALAAVRERRFAAVVVDEVGGHGFWGVFVEGMAGADGRLGTDDDPYVRLPGRILREPKAIAPLLGFEAHSPYVLVPR
jgi:hypothetical protein